MKICVVAYKFGTRQEIGKQLGSYDYFLRQLSAIRKNGATITVLAPWVSFFRRGSAEVDGIKVVRYFPPLMEKSWMTIWFYKVLNKIYMLQTKRRLVELENKNQFDAVYVRQARETGYGVALAKPQLKVPLIFQPITTWRWHFEQNNLFKKLVLDLKSQKRYAQEIFNSFDKIIVYNEEMKAEYVSLGADDKKFFIVPGAVDHEIFKPYKIKPLKESLGLSNKKIVLFIGRINFEEKGLGYLLQSFNDLKDKDDLLLVIIGPATSNQYSKLQQSINELNLAQYVKYLGPISYLELPQYINCATVGVVPSIWFESSGRVSLDMMSCGLPVIVTNAGGLAAYSINEKTGFVIPPKDSKSLTIALEKIVYDDNLQAELSAGARSHILENYSFDATAKTFLNYLTKLLIQK